MRSLSTTEIRSPRSGLEGSGHLCHRLRSPRIQGTNRPWPSISQRGICARNQPCAHTGFFMNSNTSARADSRNGSVDNAIVVDNYRILNEGGLRYSEFVAEMLDAIGDLHLAGYQLLARRGGQSGHALNNQLVRALLSSRSAGRRPLTIRLNPPSIGPYRRIFSSGNLAGSAKAVLMELLQFPLDLENGIIWPLCLR